MKAREGRNSIERREAVERRALPTPERLRRAGAEVERGHSGQMTMRDAPLERAFARNAITAEQYSAGQKYRHHWYHAGLAGYLESVDLNRVFAIDLGAYTGMAKTENQVFHRQRYREAVQAAGKIGSHVLEWAVCREIPLEQVGVALGWSPRASPRRRARADEGRFGCAVPAVGNRRRLIPRTARQVILCRPRESGESPAAVMGPRFRGDDDGLDAIRTVLRIRAGVPASARATCFGSTPS
jgi:hypothetical protein